MRPALRSILAALDLRSEDDPALRTGLALSRATGASLHLLTAVEPFEVSMEQAVSGAPSPVQGALQSARAALDGALARIGSSALETGSREVAYRRAPAAIVERAAEVSADLIVLGPHHPHAVADRLLGATAERVMRTTAVPCLVVRAPLAVPVRSVVVPIDLSPGSAVVLQEALRWTELLGSPATSATPPAEVTVLHVTSRSGPEGGPGVGEMIGPRGLEEYVRHALPGPAAPGAWIDHRVLGTQEGGGAADAILHFASRRAADLLVVGTRGRSALARAVVGSVASEVARRADRAVLLVPPAGRAQGERASAAAEPEPPHP